jgi:hypothetical protein
MLLPMWIGEAAVGSGLSAMTLDEFFAGQPESRRIFDALSAVVSTIGQAEIRVSKSQVAFARCRIFARTWMPSAYLGSGHAPLVLTLGFRRRDASPRWKQIVEPRPGCFTHHLELHSVEDIDEQVRGWLEEAWTAAA